MHVLFIHPGFPGQFRYVAPRLAAEHGWTCTFVTRESGVPPIPGVLRIPYLPSVAGAAACPATTRRFEASVGHALGVYDALKARTDVRPDLIVAHGSFGASLFLPHLYDAPIGYEIGF
jgi:hypothetical protein